MSSRGTLCPMGSMYDMFTHIWLLVMVNVGKYTIHGSYGHPFSENGHEAIQDILEVRVDPRTP